MDSRAGPFRYDYGWLSQTAHTSVMKTFADGNFKDAYGLNPDDVEIL